MTLFEEWREARSTYTPFVVDGILKEDAYRRAPLKIMFLVKESYKDFHQIAGQALPIDHGKNGFWKKVAAWRHLIMGLAQGHQVEAHPNEQELKEVADGTRNLDDIAWVNVKKSLGGSASNMSEIHRFAMDDQEFLARQIDEIQPDVVLCGRTCYAYKIIYGHPSDMIPMSEKVFVHKNRIVIDFFHPGYFAPKGGASALYARLYALLTQSPSVIAWLRARASKSS